MKNPIQKLRRFFVRSRTYNAAAAARASAQASHDDDDGGTRLSGAFIVVLVLHVIAVVGVFAFARIKESRNNGAPQGNSAQAAAPKPAPAKAPAIKAAATAATATVAAAHPQQIAQHDAPKTGIPAGHTTHVVKEGETLMRIATRYSVGVSELVSLNRLKNHDDIHTGQSLAIPAKQQQKTPTAAEDKPAQKTTPAATPHRTAKTYIVRKGDTPLKIARQHGCSYDELMKVNSIRDPKKIQTGQVLKLPVKNG
ncbi:MAG: LysM peptidoglycan-binding domain-containing protein [Chthoniobacteraceae bacterium]